MSRINEDIHRLAGWSGIAFSVLSLIVIPLVVTPPPALGSTAEMLSKWYAEHRLGFLIGNYLGVAAFIPGFIQLSVVASRFRSHARGADWISPLILSSGTFTYAVFACSLVVYQALPFLTEVKSAQSISALGTLGSIWIALDGLAALPLILAIGLATRFTRVLPGWFGRLSWLLAVIMLLVSLGSLRDHPAWLAGGGLLSGIGFVFFFLWTFLLGSIFLKFPRKGSDASEARP